MLRSLLLFGSLALLTPTGASAKPCYPAYCSHSMRVGETPVHWQTQRVKVLTRLEARYRNHVLTYWNEGCKSYSSGYGVLIRFDGCGPGAQPLRVTAVSLRKRAVTIRIVYG